MYLHEYEAHKKYVLLQRISRADLPSKTSIQLSYMASAASSSKTPPWDPNTQFRTAVRTLLTIFPPSVTLPIITQSGRCIAKVPLHPPLVTLSCKATASLIYNGPFAHTPQTKKPPYPGPFPTAPKTINPPSLLPTIHSAFNTWTFDEMDREEDEYNEWKTVEKVVQIGDWKVVFGYQGPNKDPVVERGKGNDGKSEDGRYMEDLDSDDDEESVDGLENSLHQLDVRSDVTSISSTHSLDGQPNTPRSPNSIFSNGSPNKENVSPVNGKQLSLDVHSPGRTARNSAEIPRAEDLPKGAVPVHLQPLFNHILWRIHKETNPDAALESFILLTNDLVKSSIAQKFGVRAKRLEQLRDAVAREDRELKNHLAMYSMEINPKPAPTNEPASPLRKETVLAKHSPKTSIDAHQDLNSDDEDVVLLKRAPRGPQAEVNGNQQVWDPNDFGRTNPHQSPRGGRGRGAPRGRPGPPRGRSGFVPRGGAYVPPTVPIGRGAPPAPRVNVDPNQPLDPDSFARPIPKANAARGGRRKLWEPN